MPFKGKNILLIMLTAISCTQHKNQNETKQDIEYKPLEELMYRYDSIPAGTHLNLLAYMGAIASTETEAYYSQFIAIDTRYGDTVRILSNYITVESPEEPGKKIYTAITGLDPSMQITDVDYYPVDTTLFNNILLQLTSHDGPIVFNEPKEKKKQKEFVCVTNDVAIFKGDYKTAIGVLHYKQIPW